MTAESKIRERISEQPKGVRVEWKSKDKVCLIFPSGGKLTVETKTKPPKTMSDEVFVALEVMQLTFRDAFPEETTVAGQSDYQVITDQGIEPPPGGVEQFYKTALGWAGARLQAEGWNADRVADLLIDKRARMTGSMGSLSDDLSNSYRIRLRREITEYYPGAAAQLKKSRSKKVTYW